MSEVKKQESGIQQPETRINVTTSHGRRPGMLRKVLAGGALLAVGAVTGKVADQLGVDIPTPVKLESKGSIETSKPEILKVEVTGNLCPVTADARVAVVGSLHQRFKILGRTAHTETLVDNLTVNAEGEVDACVASKDLDITLTKVPVSSSTTVTPETSAPSASQAAPTYGYKMGIVVDNIFPRSRITNLGENGSVGGEDLTNYGKFLDSLIKGGVGEERFPGVLLSIGQTTLGSGICDSAVIEATQAGLAQSVEGIANQVLEQVGEPGIISSRTTVDISKVKVSGNQNALETAEEFYLKAYRDMPEYMDVTIASATCANEFNANPLPSGRATIKEA